MVRQNNVGRLQPARDDLLERGILLVHPGLEVLDEGEIMHDALAVLRRWIGTEPHRAGDESLTRDHDGVGLGNHDLRKRLRELRQVARDLPR